MLVLAVGCSMAEGGVHANPSVGGGSGVGGAGDDDGPTSLSFEPIEQLSAREQVRLRVRAQPPGVYEVRFSLPSGNGDPLDAVLDRGSAETDAEGTAEVMLTAPSVSADFDVRASIDSELSTSLRVSVKDTGFTSVHVEPTYSGPYRNIVTWTATVHPNKSCAKLTGIPPDDGPLWATSAKDAAPTVTDVPALTPLAVTLRSGHYVGGCASVEMLPASAEAHVVQVTVLNRPVDLAASRLSLSLGLSEPEATWQDFATRSGEAVLQALPGTSSGDVDTLLDAMRAAAGQAQQALETARKSEGWDALLAAHWGSGAEGKLTATVSAWLNAGRQKLVLGDHVIEGTINLPGATDAELDLQSIAGLAPERAGFTTPSRISWSATSDDQVLLGTEIYVIGSRLASGLAEAVALSLNDETESAPEALSRVLDCAGLSVALAGAGADGSLAYPTCNAACLEELCQQAISAVWQRGRDATALSPTRLSLSASGQAYVGDAAEVAGINGTWIGALKQGDTQAPTGGTLKAATPKD
jgi:hypothetical protein